MGDVKLFKRFRYRIYPTCEQSKRLEGWLNSLRFIWNLCHEQRLMGVNRPRGCRIFPSSFDQSKELTELRKEIYWLSDIPRHCADGVVQALGSAWDLYLQRKSRRPLWKSKSRPVRSLSEFDHRQFSIGVHSVKFPKLGKLRAVVHRPLEGKPKTCTLKRDGDQWFATIVCEIDAPAPTPRKEPMIAIDRGVTNTIADSDGRLVPNPRHYERSLKRLAHAQRIVARRKKGSKNREKAKLRVMRLHRKVRRQREHFLHVESSRLAKNHGVVVIEKLNVAGMVRARPLSRSIANAGWSTFAEMLRYKLAWSGGTLIEVPAQYSSQTCSAGGAVDAASRKAECFCCTTCGHIDHADINAAKVLKTRASRSGLPVEGSAPEATQRSRKDENINHYDYRA